MSKPRFVVAAHSAQLQLSTGAVERAGGVVLGALDDGDRLVLSVPPPMPDAVIAAVVAPRPRALPLVAAMLGAVAPSMLTHRRDAPPCEATEHGTAAARKAEAPPRESHDLLAVQADAMGFEESAS